MPYSSSVTVHRKVPTICITKENVADIKTENFDGITQTYENLYAESKLKQEKWQEEKREVRLRVEAEAKAEEEAKANLGEINLHIVLWCNFPNFWLVSFLQEVHCSIAVLSIC